LARLKNIAITKPLLAFILRGVFLMAKKKKLEEAVEIKPDSSKLEQAEIKPDSSKLEQAINIDDGVVKFQFKTLVAVIVSIVGLAISVAGFYYNISSEQTILAFKVKKVQEDVTALNTRIDALMQVKLALSKKVDDVLAKKEIVTPPTINRKRPMKVTIEVSDRSAAVVKNQVAEVVKTVPATNSDAKVNPETTK
jgi:hypothetical protein